MAELKYDVCFVQSGESPDDSTENMKLAFESMDANDLQPVWITPEDCLQICKKEAKLFVMDPFEGEAFDHFIKVQCRVVGPLCILSCLQLSDVLPKRPYPVYSVSMRRISLSCSNVEKTKREAICKKVELMGGIFSRDLTKSVTHLVVGEVGSKKYHVAANFGLPVMLPEWIDSVWESQPKLLHASDSYFDKFKCPIFKGIVICVSQLSCEERQAVKSIVESNGGKYTGALQARKTTHLVLSEPTGDKFRFAKSWKVFCIKVSWIHDSIEYGYARDESLYQLDGSNPTPKRSTPLKDRSSILPQVDCSAISSNSLISHLDETTRTDVSIAVIPKKSIHALDGFDISTLPKCGQFLDGCKIFLTGFNSAQMDKLRKIVNAGGGMRFSKYSDSISHVVCEGLSDELLENIKSSSVKPHVVNFNWLLECCKHDKMVEENNFLCIELDAMSPQKKCEQSVTSNNTTINENVKNSFNFSSQTDDMNPDNITDIFRQYIQEDEVDLGQDENNELKTLDPQGNAKCTDLSKNNLKENQTEVVCEEITIIDDETSSQQLFRPKTFKISGFMEKDTEILSSMIETHGGIMLPLDSDDVSDICIVPLIWNDLNLNADQIVTNCWLQKCIEETQLFDFDENELFKPLDVNLSCKPFQNLVLSVSQYSGTERDCLMHLAESLGATCQEYFVRKANQSKSVLPNTHLIALTPDGSKYEAAKKWKIPAVTKYWVLDAFKSGSVPPVENYLVENATETNDKDRETNGNVPAVKVDNVFTFEDVLQKRDNIENNEVTNKASNSSVLMASHKRVMEIMDFNKPSPMRGKRDVSLNESLCKPSDIRFNVSGLLKDIDSCSSGEGFVNGKKTSSPTLGELFSRNLSVALENISVFNQTPKKLKTSEQEDKIDDNLNPPEKSTVLKGVVVCVAKKLSALQTELYEIVTSLGGDYLWSYDKTCTHYVFQGKLNDITKEFRVARNENKIIVAPEWVYACRDENAHVSEKSYPHTFKSRMSLNDQVVTSKVLADDVFESNEIRPGVASSSKVAKSSTKAGPVDFNKELDDLLAAAKSAKRSNPRRLTNSNSNSPSDKISALTRGHFSDEFDNQFHRSLTEDKAEEVDNFNSQFSQTYPITWDDPTGRLEREKIAARLAANQVENQNSKEDAVSEPNDVNDSEPVALSKKCPKFMFTGFSDAERLQFSATVKSLGGEVCEDKAFDPAATHLLLDKPLKNEKFLASVASGKFILHSSYLSACAESELFVCEEMYEWGGVSTSKFLRDPSRALLKVANCAYRWRTAIQGNESMVGAFQEWNVLIYADDRQKHETYENIVKSGGATVVPYPTPESAISEVTHVFVESKKRPLQIDLNPFIANNVKCLKPEYLAFYLIEDPAPNPDDFLLPDVKDRYADSSNQKKRNLHIATRGSKRSRLK